MIRQLIAWAIRLPGRAYRRVRGESIYDGKQLRRQPPPDPPFTPHGSPYKSPGTP